MNLGTSVDLSWKAAIVPYVNVITTRIYVIEKAEVVSHTVKIIPLAGIVNDVKMAHMGMLQSNNVKVSAGPFWVHLSQGFTPILLLGGIC